MLVEYIEIELRLRYKLKDILRVINMPPRTYYNILKSIVKEDKYKEVKEEIMRIYEEHKGLYGYRRIYLELINRGYKYSERTILNLMRELGIKGKFKQKKYKNNQGPVGKAADNVLQRDFKSDKACTKLTTDITEISVGKEKIYLSAILDMYNSEIVAYKISNSPNMKLVYETLMDLLAKLHTNNGDITIHSDQGWQYRHCLFRDELKKHNITQSMSRKGNCYDNAIMESFFGRLKTEILYNRKYASIEELKNAIIEYINYYNNVRIKARLNGKSPMQYRLERENAH